jgi:hypothetical protein
MFNPGELFHYKRGARGASNCDNEDVKRGPGQNGCMGHMWHIWWLRPGNSAPEPLSPGPEGPRGQGSEAEEHRAVREYRDTAAAPQAATDLFCGTTVHCCTADCTVHGALQAPLHRAAPEGALPRAWPTAKDSVTRNTVWMGLGLHQGPL